MYYDCRAKFFPTWFTNGLITILLIIVKFTEITGHNP